MSIQEVEMVNFKNDTISPDERLIGLLKEIPPDTFLVSSDGRTFPSHYMVLTMFSQYFRKYFNKVPFQYGMKIPMKDISSESLTAALMLFYSFETQIARNLVPEFRSAMQLLEVDNFAYECDTVLMKAINDAMMVPSTKPKSQIFWEDFDNDEAYEDFPQVGLELHKNHNKMYWDCSGPDCNVRCVTKMIDGKVMIFKNGKSHSVLCDEHTAENCNISETEVYDEEIGHYFREDTIIIKAIKDMKFQCAELNLDCGFDGCDGLFKAKIVRGKLMGRRNTKHTPECELKAQKVKHPNAEAEQVPSHPVVDDEGISDAELVNAECPDIGADGDDVVETKNNHSSECIIS